MDPLSKELNRLNRGILDMEAQGRYPSSEYHGLQAEIQSLINANLPKPEPFFPPTHFDR